MTCERRLLLRAAVAIHEQMMQETTMTEQAELPVESWQQIELLDRRIRRARERGWHLAAGRLRVHLLERAGRLSDSLFHFKQSFRSQHDQLCSLSGTDVFEDLIALDQEFSELSIDLREQTVSVTTEPIELEEVFLGRFNIQLDWNRLTNGHPNNYRVIAVEPNPAASNDGVTHPHVQDEAVCEGEGGHLIRNALKQGRLLDFFLTVGNLLRTYNSSSPFVRLEDWHEVACADCGTTVCDDERWTCEKCESAVCGECYFSCPGCEGIFCSDCVTQCQGCHEYQCAMCMSNCSGCHNEYCQSCLSENERCSDCHDQETQEERDEADDCEESAELCIAKSPLQSNRLGEATVPAGLRGD